MSTYSPRSGVPSARSRPSARASCPGGVRPLAVTTRCQGTPPPYRAMTVPTWRGPPLPRHSAIAPYDITRAGGIRSTSPSTSSVKSTRTTLWDPAGTPGSPDRRMGSVREAVETARRIVVKVGSSALTTAAGGLARTQVDALVDALAAVTGEVVLVSSGAIAAGLAPLGLARRPRDLATQQAAASVGQGLLMQAYTDSFNRYGRT